MNSKVVFGQYYDSNSWIHRLDPRVKIIALILLLVSVFLVSNVIVLGGITLAIVILILTSKVPFMRFLKSLKMVLFLLLFTFIFQIILNKDGTLLLTIPFELNVINLIGGIVLLVLYFLSGKIIRKGRFVLFFLSVIIIFVGQYYLKYGPIIAIYNVELYEEGLYVAGKIILRVVNCLFLSTLLTLTTKPTELNIGLEKLLSPLQLIKVPIGIFTMMISIALRFIPTLLNETDKILKAQASRGVDFKEGNISSKIGQIVSLIVPMFAISYNKADDLACAMEARAYDPYGKRTSINYLHMRFIDYFTLIFTFLLLGLTIAMVVIYAI